MRTPWGNRVRLAAGVAALGWLMAPAGGERLTDPRLPKLETRPVYKAGRRLEALGLYAYWPMDERVLAEWIHRGPVTTDGTRRVPGIYGDAREILPGEHGYIRTGIRVESMGSNFTVACWLRFPGAVPDQRVLGCLRVLDGRLVPFLHERPQPLAWPIGIRGRFFHLAWTADRRSGVQRLYVDGAPVAEAPLDPADRPFGGVCFGQDQYAPPAGFAIDEACLWSRPLAPDEILRYACPRRGRGAAAFAWLDARLRLGRLANDAAHALLLTRDLFNPLSSPRSPARAGLPNHSLVLSRHDVRAVNLYHNTRTDHALSGPGDSGARRIGFLEEGRLRGARMKVLGGERIFPRGVPKRAYVIEVEGDDGGDGPDGGVAERFVFRPPEEGPFLLEILAGELARACAMPVDAPAFCTLDINGASEGIFLRERVSMDPAVMWVGEPGGWERCLDRLPVFGADVVRAFDEIDRRYRRALASDRKSPWTAAEMRRAVREQRDLLVRHLGACATEQRSDRALVDKVCAFLAPDLFLGANPMPECVLGNLDLAARRVNGADVTFTSLHPDALGDDGRLLRPGSTAPRPVAVRASVRCGGVAGEVTLPYPLAGGGERLPILSVKAAGTVREETPTLCLTRLLEANGSAGDVREGGIHIRGNTSRVKTLKHYYEIEYPSPHGIAGLAESRHLLLTSMYRDPTLMREKLAYDLFRSFSRPGSPRYAPHVRLIELVVNGRYAGVYEMTDRVDADLLGFTAAAAVADRAHPPVLYKAVGASANFRSPAPDAYVQKVPRWRERPFWGPYRDLIGFIGTSDPATFRERIGEVIDIDNAVDFELLLGLTCNAEACNFNLFLARRGGPRERFFLVPWDYDMTFWYDIKPTNYLIERLHRDVPDYLPRLKARWLELRRGVLADEAVSARIDEMDALLNAGAADRNYRIWPLRDPKLSHEQEVKILRSWVARRLDKMDRNMAGIPDQAP